MDSQYSLKLALIYLISIFALHFYVIRTHALNVGVHANAGLALVIKLFILIPLYYGFFFLFFFFKKKLLLILYTYTVRIWRTIYMRIIHMRTDPLATIFHHRKQLPIF